MIDINLLRTQPDLIRDLCQRREADVDVDKLIALDRELRQGLGKLESLRHDQKKVSEQVRARPELREEANKLKEQIKDLEESVRRLETDRNALWARLPNLLAPDTPEGKDDADNVQIN